MFGRSAPLRLLLAAAFATPLASVAQQLTVNATHELAIARPSEMIALPWGKVTQALPGATADKLIVRDAAGRTLAHQHSLGELLFQYDFAPGERAAVFTVAKSDSAIPPFPARTFARFVPERFDDFAWENDRVAHRAYGPALAGPGAGKERLVASGIDVWSKRVRYPVIDRWYKKGSYHRDDGEGLDLYKTGASRGTGGSGVWDGKALHVSANFARWKILANGPIRTVFELAYDPWNGGPFFVSEVKRFTVDAGHNFDQVDSTFFFDGPKEITVGLGITSNSAEQGEYAGADVQRLPQEHALLQWEVRKTQGGLGEALIVPGGASGYAEDATNRLILARTTTGRALRYYAGAGWTGSGDFAGKQAWFDYVAAAAARVNAPVTVTVAEPMAEVIRKDLAIAAAQYTHLLDTIKGKSGFPRTVEQGEVKLVNVRDWTIGFFPGSLWYLFEATGDAKWRTAAVQYTQATAPAKFDGSNHDLGFMLYCGYGNGLRLGGGPAYRDALLAGATTLVTRFNPKVGSIQSWNIPAGKDWTFPVIVDNMMNLELLMWAAREAQEPHYRAVAIAHADTTLKHHFRDDGSSYHLVDYTTQGPTVRSRVTVQGHADGSAWARGQAWGLYGYTMMYRETKYSAYLQQARKIAAFVMNHPRLPADKVPYWDFDDPAIPAAPRDSSAAAIISSALLELSRFVPPDEGRRYAAFAEHQLRSLSSAAYLAAPGENGGFLLKHATGHKPAGREIDVPLNYGDYYFLEALLRYKTMHP